MDTFVLFIKEYDNKVLSLTKKLIKSIDKNKFNVLLIKSQAKKLNLTKLSASENKIRKASFVVSIGGDGTMLRCARIFSKHDIPIIGINLGRRGFLTEIKISDFKKILKSLFLKKYKIDQRIMLDVEIKRKNKTILKMPALNDVVIGKNGIARIIRLKTFVNNEIMTSYSGDGLIIATPTGSTGHNLAANGPIIDPSLKTFVVTAICPLAITNRPVVIDANKTIKVEIEDTPKGIEAILTIDGQSTMLLSKGDKIIVKIHPHITKFIRLRNYNFFTVLKNKLNWGN